MNLLFENIQLFHEKRPASNYYQTEKRDQLCLTSLFRGCLQTMRVYNVFNLWRNT